MVTDAGYMRMGSQPVAGRARTVHVCQTGGSLGFESARPWHLDLAVAGLAVQAIKPTTRIHVAVPDTNRIARRPRGNP